MLIMTKPASKPLIVLDWDGVIFDDRKPLFGALAELGLTDTRVEELYQASKDEHGYNDVRFAALAAKALGISEAVTYAAVQKVACRAAEFVYGDALEFIQAAEAARYEVVVLTAGVERIQLEKIAHSNLAQFFRDVHVVPVGGTEHNKSQVLEKMLAQHDRIIFFDDRLATIAHMREVFQDRPQIVPIWVCRTGQITAFNAGRPAMDRLRLDIIEQYMNMSKAAA
jgi:FMN phosphatase YigB (HAD superfamily)